MPYFFKILVDTPAFNGILWYKHPTQLAVGLRVTVAVVGRTYTGVVWSCEKKPNHLKESTIKSIKHTFNICFNDNNFNLFLWMQRYYHVNLSAICHMALPAIFKKHTPEPQQEIVYLTKDTDKKLTPKQRATVQFLQQHKNNAPYQRLLQEANGTKAHLKPLINKGIIACKKHRFYFYKNHAIKRLPHTLNTEQNQAVLEMTERIKQGFFCHFLQGKTGSGKTEIYAHLIQKLLENIEKQQILVLVPEINLAYALADYLKNTLSHPIAIFHSGLSNNQCLEIWNSVLHNKPILVVGTRSAIWLPFSHLAGVVIDEANDTAFKQNTGPLRYCARQTAIMLAKQHDVPVFMGSGTPDIQALHNIQKKRWFVSHIHNKVHGNNVSIRLVDISQSAPNTIVHPTLKQRILHTLKQNNQVLVFSNQRGLSRCLYCSNCQSRLTCTGCQRPQVLHNNNRLHCHLCSTKQNAPEHCPYCNHQSLLKLGFGTQKIEAFLKQEFHYPVFRIDSDQEKHNLDSIQCIKEGQPCIVTGTKMIAKGHDFPKMALCIMLNTDYALSTPDFYQEEDAFALIEQVIGRIGRSGQTAEAFIQTRQPLHPFYQNLIHQKENAYQDALRSIMQQRLRFQLPPFSYHAMIRARDKNKTKLFNALSSIQASGRSIADKHGVKIHAPMPALIGMQNSYHYAYVLLESKKRTPLATVLSECKPLIALQKKTITNIIIDVDPINI